MFPVPLDMASIEHIFGQLISDIKEHFEPKFDNVNCDFRLYWNIFSTNKLCIKISVYNFDTNIYLISKKFHFKNINYIYNSIDVIWDTLQNVLIDAVAQDG